MSEQSNQKTDSSEVKAPNVFLVTRKDGTYEQVVMAEVLLPDTPNVYGDIYTRESIREFAYQFAIQGYGIDVNHDNVDVQGQEAVVVESFIARPGDPNFIEGSWVVGMKILDSEVWQQVLDGTINGYSFEAECSMLPVVFQNLTNRQVIGSTEPDPVDGHTHEFLVILDVFNRPISGGTSIVNGHSHPVVHHTITENQKDLMGRSHSHRYQVIRADHNEEDKHAGTH